MFYVKIPTSVTVLKILKHHWPYYDSFDVQYAPD